MLKGIFFSALAIVGSAHAYEVKFTKGTSAPDLGSLLEKAKADTGLSFNAQDFVKIEERNLATSRYQFFVQVNSLVPVSGTAVRIWTDLKTNELILAELHLDEKAKKNAVKLAALFERAKFSQSALRSKQLSERISSMVSETVATHDTDARVLGIKSQDMWLDGDLVRAVDVRGRRGVHHVKISLLKNRIIAKEYTEFPQSEAFTTVKANVFPMYEEVEGTGEKLHYEVKELKYIYPRTSVGGKNPLGVYGKSQYKEDLYNPISAETAHGEMMGYWSESTLRKEIEGYVSKLPTKENSFVNGLLLQGKYATINLHPAVAKEIPGINFSLTPTVNHMLSWIKIKGGYAAVPTPGLSGKVISSEADLLSRIPERLPKHDVAAYINSGVDEAQVYYGVTVLMETLAEMGFTDAELSTKPFHAFLFDPDLGMQDNAYYTDNTINFTTYTPGSPNLARDNPTIWHELGHGVMERIMGSHLAFGDSKGGYGGLSEGMADFVAKIVVEHQTAGEDFPGKYDFRIMNETGFYLTNEYHDEGESYGGAMNDMLRDAIDLKGRAGLFAFTDLTLEAMRLTRNHPSLTARSWFEHMIYADELGSSVRAPGEFSQVITDALLKRNFAFDPGFKPAAMNITFNGTELTSASPASREKPLVFCESKGPVSHDLKLSVTSGDSSFIKFPAVVKVEYKKGALQGAIKWEGKDSNPTVYVLNSESELLNIPIKALGCDAVNQPDDSCKDYAYVQVFNQGDLKPRAKKRFYLKIKKSNC